MTPAYDTGLLGAVLSAMSVVVVFQLFVLQNWLQSIYALATEVEQCLVRTIPGDIEFQRLTSLSFEARQKLEAIRPSTIGQAARISGVSPADISVLLVYLGR